MKVLCAVEKLVFITNGLRRRWRRLWLPTDQYVRQRLPKWKGAKSCHRTSAWLWWEADDFKTDRYYIRPVIKFAAVQTFEFLITLLRSLLKATFNALESCPPSEVDFHLFENCFPTKPGLCCCSAIEMPFTRPERNPVCNSGAHHCYYLPTKL